jgi:hypothetical protein
MKLLDLIIPSRIFAVRNWWAHVGVSIDDCAAALQAVADFIKIMLQQLKLPDDFDTSGLINLLLVIDSISIKRLSDLKLTVDQVAYLYLVRTFRRLTTFSERILLTHAHSEFGQALSARMRNKEKAFVTRRQKSVTESVDVARSVLDIQGLNGRIKGDCMIIVRARNCFAHEAEQSSRVLAAACAIGAVRRLLDFIVLHCKLDGDASQKLDVHAASLEIDEYQTKLLALMGALDLPYLLQQLTLSCKNELDACKYLPMLSTDYEKAMMLLTMRAPRHVVASSSPVAHPFDFSLDLKMAKRQRSLLRTVRLVPPSVHSQEAAVEWLLSLTEITTPKLLGCSGLRALCHSVKKKLEKLTCGVSTSELEPKLHEVLTKKHKIPTFKDSWIELVPEKSQIFLVKLIREADELIQSQQDVLDAEELYEITLEKSQEAKEKKKSFDGCEHPSGESNVDRLTRLSKCFLNHRPQEIYTCVMNLRKAVAQRDSKEASLNALQTDSASLQEAKESLVKAFQNTLTSSCGEALTWDAIKQISHLLPSHSDETFHSLFDPSSIFEFYNVFGHKGSSELCKPMFDNSVELLAPMFEIVGAQPDASALEASLGSDYLHGMTMLAVLASRSLQPQVEAHSTDITIPVKVVFQRLTAGMSATVIADDQFIGREAERPRIRRRLLPLFQSGSACDASLVLVRGQPGTGKSCLAKQQLCLVQNEFCVAEVSNVFASCISGRGRDAVRDALHRLGLDLRFRLEIDSAATIDIVLPLLNIFLAKHRFVLLVDDVDHSGLEELLLHVPPSSAGCCIILTSQMVDIEITTARLAPIHGFQFNTDNADGDDVHLGCFTPEVALALVEQICKGSDLSRIKLPEILSGDDDACGLGLLPLGVRVFAEWLRHELVNKRAEDAISVWKSECQVVVSDNLFHGHRGLRATVRLALHNIANDTNHEACRQLLGLLALCPPVQVPWSLFDGGCMSAEHEFHRGRRVEVSDKREVGRVMQLNADNSIVSVVFGCETGACFLRATNIWIIFP